MEPSQERLLELLSEIAEGEENLSLFQIAQERQKFVYSASAWQYAAL
jgi:hypothetical protein